MPSHGLLGGACCCPARLMRLLQGKRGSGLPPRAAKPGECRACRGSGLLLCKRHCRGGLCCTASPVAGRACCCAPSAVASAAAHERGEGGVRKGGNYHLHAAITVHPDSRRPHMWLNISSSYLAASVPSLGVVLAGGWHLRLTCMWASFHIPFCAKAQQQSRWHPL